MNRSTPVRKWIWFLLALFAANGFSQSAPPDAPLSPPEWIARMGDGAWFIFRIPPRPDNIITVQYESRILDTMQQAFCINGGRLHWSAGAGRNNMFLPGTFTLRPEALDSLEVIIDDMIERNMSFCLMVDFQADGFLMNDSTKTRYYEAWRQVSERFAGKSHLMAMSPVIEFHGWYDLPPAQRYDSLNVFYDTLTRIFRRSNPTRILSFKPWGSARKAKFETLALPFGNDPAPRSGDSIYYVVSCSGGYGLGDWWKWSDTIHPDTLAYIKEQSLNAGLNPDRTFAGIRKAVQFRDSTGIYFWVDHWSPNFFKHLNDSYPTRWTVEQNIAYVRWMRDTLKVLGTAGAGIQINKYWNDETHDLYRPVSRPNDFTRMALALIDAERQRCSEMNISEHTSAEPKIYPNPVGSCLRINSPQVPFNRISIHDLNGRVLFRKQFRHPRNRFGLNTSFLPPGIYILQTNRFRIRFIKKT